MNGLVFYIGLGIGLAVACGLRPFLPLLLAGALALRTTFFSTKIWRSIASRTTSAAAAAKLS